MESTTVSPVLSVNKKSHELDVASAQDSFTEFTPEELKQLDKIYRKLDWRIIPPLWCLWFLSSFGAPAYGNALTMNQSQGHSIIQTLKLTDHDTSTATALDFVGTVLFDVPMNLIMTVVTPQSWLFRIIASSGIVYSCFPAVKNATGLIIFKLVVGICSAGVWPGMAYYISLWYPSHRTARRIGYYFTASQVSCAVAGLVAAGFQKIDGNLGLTGAQWLFLTYGVITIAVGISLLWWLPDRPSHIRREPTNALSRFMKKIVPASFDDVLTPEEAELHARDLKLSSLKVTWNLKDFIKVMTDIRIWPLITMYFGVVGVGFGLTVFATKIIEIINPNLSDIDLSLLTAPIWLCDLVAILLITPFSDYYKRRRDLVFSLACVVIIVGLIVTTFAKHKWPRYVGLLICGFGLGPTVPINMTWAAEIFRPRHGDLGVAMASALVTGLGNLGSVTTTYALYTGWASDPTYMKSNMVMVGILGVSIISAVVCTGLRLALGDIRRL